MLTIPWKIVCLLYDIGSRLHSDAFIPTHNRTINTVRWHIGHQLFKLADRVDDYYYTTEETR